VLQRFDVADLGIDARADLAGRIAAWVETVS
jgi:tRNA 2-selenouridine synthase